MKSICAILLTLLALPVFAGGASHAVKLISLEMAAKDEYVLKYKKLK